MRGVGRAAGITRHRLLHAADVLVDRLHAPETAAGKDRDLVGRAGGGECRVDGRRRDRHPFGPRHSGQAERHEEDRHQAE